MAGSQNARQGMPSSLAQSTILTCATCNGRLAYPAPEGGFIMAQEEEACDVCRPFEKLYAAVLTADKAVEEVQHRRRDFGGRVQAEQSMRAAHMTLGNFIHHFLHFRKVPTPSGYTSAPESTKTTGCKRARDDEGSENADHRSYKRQKRRSVGFDESVVFHEHPRDSNQFLRGSDEYTRGRYAAPDRDELLDTSGSEQSFQDFYKMKKVKKKWVSTDDPEGDEADTSTSTSSQESLESTKGDEH